jgi:hypothetical protein
MNPLDELEETLEVLSEAIQKRDKQKAFNAVAAFIGLCAATFDPDFFAKISPTIEKLKQHLKDEQFEDARALCIAFLTRIRQAIAPKQ